MSPVIAIKNLSKSYESGHKALDDVSLDINKGEILALLGPNGAGKTTLISIVCGIVDASSGSVTVGGADTIRDYRKARSMIGLVPQELHTETFESVWATVRFSRGLFGKGRDDQLIEQILRDLSLWDKKDAKIKELSGGMKRRVMIAKALSHEPQVLFLDEPTAGVDVELRKDMWQMIRRLRDKGVTVILTTHYIEEAEEMADRIGVINKGELLLVEDKSELMRKLGQKELIIDLRTPVERLPEALANQSSLRLSPDGRQIVYTYDTQASRTGIASLLSDLREADINLRDLSTRQSSLEDIFVQLVRDGR